MSEIQLRERQVNHFKRLCQILGTEHGYVDTSPTGAGKTVVTLKVAQTYGLGLVLVCPRQVLKQWQREASKYGVPLYEAMSYSSLSGRATRKGSSTVAKGLLMRTDTPTVGPQGPMIETTYLATTKYAHLVKRGVLVVFDECHYGKNEAALCTRAGHTLTHVLSAMNCGSRIALLSRTLMNDPKHAQQVYKLLGIITHRKLSSYDPRTQKHTQLGLTEAYNKAYQYGGSKAGEVGEIKDLSADMGKVRCFVWYHNILRFHLSSMMPKPEEKKTIRNVFYKPNLQDLEEIASVMDELQQLSKDVGSKKSDFATRRNDIYQRLTRYKLSMLAEHLFQFLERNTNTKVLVYAFYVSHFKVMKQALDCFGCRIISGEVDDEEREETISLFQKPTAECRVLILQQGVGGTGLNLDDRDGNWPRISYLIPNFRFIELFQASGRTSRGEETKSWSEVNFIYFQGFEQEVKILDRLVEQAKVVSMVQANDEDKIPFPSEIECVDHGM